MSILIEGMEMPTDDMKNIMIFADGRVFQFSGYGNPKPLGTVIPVPEPHGRLGDLDELYDHLNEWYLTHEHGFLRNEKIYIRAMLSGVKDAPTVIPASAEVSA